MLLDKLPETPAPKNDLRLLYHNSESMSIHAKKARRISVDIIRQSALRKVLKNLWDCDIIILSTISEFDGGYYDYRLLRH